MDTLLREITAYLDSAIVRYPGGIPEFRAEPKKLAVLVHGDEVSTAGEEWSGAHAEFLAKICEKGIGVARSQIVLIAVEPGKDLSLQDLQKHSEGLRGVVSFGVLPPSVDAAESAQGKVLQIAGLPFLMTLPLVKAETADGKRMLWQELKGFLEAL